MAQRPHPRSLDLGLGSCLCIYPSPLMSREGLTVSWQAVEGTGNTHLGNGGGGVSLFLVESLGGRCEEDSQHST